ncbi:hypothetical protein C0J52_13105 [Blattella germanica]|nr:hypothetical protein C0J52_13105 [Blattella germanica]
MADSDEAQEGPPPLQPSESPGMCSATTTNPTSDTPKSKFTITRLSLTKAKSLGNLPSDRILWIRNITKNDSAVLHRQAVCNMSFFDNAIPGNRGYIFPTRESRTRFLDNVDRAKLSSQIELNAPASSDADYDTGSSSSEEQYQLVQHRKKAPKSSERPRNPSGITQMPAPSPQPTTSTPTPAKDNACTVRVYQHSIKGGNPFFLKQLLATYGLPLPKHQFYGARTQISTFEFLDKETVAKFIESVPPTSFGPQATYEIPKHPQQGRNIPANLKQDWNAVMRGVDPEITEEELAEELTATGTKFRHLNRILSTEGIRTHMVRIFFEDEESTSNAIFNGITILGRRFRVEAPREEARHLPCRRCAQYGHTAGQCKRQAICFKCGGIPGKCSHPPQANPLYCATCQKADHYTGQVKCPAYPRATAPPSEPRYIPLAQKQPAQSPPKPSRQDFPPLTQNAWAKPLIHEASTKTTNNQTPTHQETTTTPQSENISPPPPHLLPSAKP